MKNIKTSGLGTLFALVVVAAFGTAAARADINDIRDSRIISARAGRVNFISGDARLRRAGSLEWRALTAEDELKSGDTVGVATGRVEILLNPGSYFRAGAGAEFTLAEAELNDLRVELARGGAVVEAMGYGDNDLSITVSTPRSKVRILRTGVYRINALADGAAELIVLDGRALLGETLVKGGKVARAGAGGVEVSKFDKKNRDELDLWSRERGKELAQANERLQRRTLNTVFARNSFDNLFGYGSGFWFYNERSRCYTFLPFGYGWRSPYGYWYETGIVVNPNPSGGWGRPGQTPGTYPPGTNGGGTNPSGGGYPGGGGHSGGGGGAAPSRPSAGDSIDRTPVAPRTETPSVDRPPRRDQ